MSPQDIYDKKPPDASDGYVEAFNKDTGQRVWAKSAQPVLKYLISIGALSEWNGAGQDKRVSNPIRNKEGKSVKGAEMWHVKKVGASSAATDSGVDGGGGRPRGKSTSHASSNGVFK